VVTTYTADGRPKGKGQSFAPQGVVVQAYVATTAGTSLANTATIPFTVRGFDPFAWFDATLSRFLPKVAGYYRVSVATSWINAGDTTVYGVGIRKNGVNIRYGYDIAGNAVNGVEVVATTLVYLNGSTDYVDCQNAAGVARSIFSQGTVEHSAFEAELVASSVGVAPEPWHQIGNPGEPAFQNSWSNYGGGTGAHERGGFMKDPHGFVHLRGLLQAPASPNVVAFTLPVGYRPTYIQMFSTVCAGNAMGRIQVNSDGTFQFMAAVANDFATIAGLTFKAEQ
jgi:hypothetical protein